MRVLILIALVSVLGFGDAFRLSANLCPNGKPMVYCFIDPCMLPKCTNHEDAKCWSDYCGGCIATWKLPDGSVVDDCINDTQ
ncbi:hypothetical protein SNE40_022432 [Patella caerulea]|uniref:Uncharacterized protein n=1 Tax=Patella caerulea TaxID=87958 RepID=A0AAN8G820_PATCE